MRNYAALLPYCETERQAEIIRSLVEHKSHRKAAKAMSLNPRNLNAAVHRVKQAAARQGYSPDHGMTHPVPDTHIAKGVSTLYDADGAIRAQWVKSSLKAEEQLQALRDAVEALRDDIPKAKPVAAPKTCAADLLNLYVITDFHLGMRAWPEETRSDAWDTDIAEKMLVEWFAKAIQTGPAAGTAVLAQLGDLLHFDSLQAVTPTSGHLLDADTRYQRVVRVVIRVLRQVVAMLLAKHDSVHIIMAEGNHDIASSAWLREVFAAFYSDEPRVTVDTSPDPYYCYEFGANGLFFHHGHLRKMAELDKVFASKFRDVFGRTKYAEGHSGHLHHDRAIESALMTIYQHDTLAANDSHGSRHGYKSKRCAPVITYHRDHGRVQSLSISPDMIAA